MKKLLKNSWIYGKTSRKRLIFGEKSAIFQFCFLDKIFTWRRIDSRIFAFACSFFIFNLKWSKNFCNAHFLHFDFEQLKSTKTRIFFFLFFYISFYFERFKKSDCFWEIPVGSVTCSFGFARLSGRGGARVHVERAIMRSHENSASVDRQLNQSSLKNRNQPLLFLSKLWAKIINIK